MNLKRVLLFFLYCLLQGPLSAQLRMTVQVDERQISLQDYLHVQFTIENAQKVTRFSPPVFQGFAVLQGPEYTNGWTLVNGEMKEYVAIGFTLRAKKTGKLTIPSASAVADGKSLRTETVTVQVSSQPSPPKNIIPPAGGDQPLDDMILHRGEDMASKIRKNIFVKLDVSRRSVYVGEPVEAVYKLYTRLNSESKVMRRPSFAGFSVFDMAEPEAALPVTERLNGRDYNVYLLRHVQLYPLQAGTYDLESMQVDNTIRFIRESVVGDASTLNGILRSMGAEALPPDAWAKEQVSLENPPVAVEVKPLPEAGQPSLYSGAVGQFSLKLKPPARPLVQGESFTYELVLEGRGNLPVIAAPIVQWGSQWESFEPEIRENIQRTFSPLSGTKTYAFPVTPLEPGRHPLPRAMLVYFEPGEGKYKTVRTDSLEVDVQPGSVKPRDPAAGDARADKAGSGNRGTANPSRWLQSPWKWVWVGLAFVLIALTWLLRRKPVNKSVIATRELDSYEAEDRETVKQLSIFPATYSLDQARLFQEQGDEGAFYKELSRVIRAVLAERYNLSGWEGRDLVEAGLKKAWVDPAVVQATLRVLARSQQALYAPHSDPEAMEYDLMEAQVVLDGLQK
jgi:hypothetical protein